MKLKPHTYRRLAWGACWTVTRGLHGTFEEYRPAQHELKCLEKLLSLYKAFLEQFKNIDYVDRELNPELQIHHGDPEVWKSIRNCQDPSIADKITFSCFGTQEFREAAEKLQRKQMLLIGVETHVCVLQTALDA